MMMNMKYIYLSVYLSNLSIKLTVNYGMKFKAPNSVLLKWPVSSL